MRKFKNTKKCILFLLIIIIAFALFAKFTKPNKLVAEEITEIVLISPPFER